MAGKNTGIHVHINAAPHDARTLRNITNIMYSKEDLIYKALQVDVEREHRYCQKVEEDFLHIWQWKGGVHDGQAVDSKYNIYPIPNTVAVIETYRR